MGFISRLIVSLLIAWFAGTSIKDALVSAGLGTKFNINPEMFFPLTAFVIFIFLTIFFRPRNTVPPAVQVLKAEPTVSSATFTKDDAHQIKELLTKGDMISAIKLIRSISKLGLKEAKDFAEHFKASGMHNITIQTSGMVFGDDGIFKQVESAEERLKKLNDLKEKNLVSSAEYEQKRKEILGEL